MKLVALRSKRVVTCVLVFSGGNSWSGATFQAKFSVPEDLDGDPVTVDTIV